MLSFLIILINNSTGSWSSLVSDCLPNNCSAISVDHGSLNQVYTTLSNGTTISVSCDHNYVIQGNNW